MIAPLHMGWRHVLFASWPVEPAVVASRLPDALSVDVRGGDAWLSVVPFTNVDVRPAWWPGRGFDLPELNLRTYVVHGDDPGVYFFSLDADGVLGVIGARLFHHLPYYYARIDLEARVESATPAGDSADRASEPTDAGADPTAASTVGASEAGPPVAAEVRFRSRRRHPGASPARLVADYGPSGERFEADPGSLEHFLTERYRYYATGPLGGLRYADVSHEPWPLYPATYDVEAETLFEADGFDRPAGEPVCHYSPGVDTVASGSRRA